MTTDDPWAARRLDLDAYLGRIGAAAGTAQAPPGEALLAHLHRRHVLAIPFENLDIALGRGVDPDLDAVQRKLVRSERGGYCYEHATLFAAALERLGFGVRRLLARIGHHPEDPRPRTHMALHVSATQGEWLADVGFGGTLLDPLPWNSATAVTQGGWHYRITQRHGARVLEQRDQPDQDAWVALHTLTDDVVHPADVVEVNHFTATHPSSPFVGSLVAMRREPNRRIRLHDLKLEIETPSGGVTRRALDPAHAVAVLARDFGLRLDPADRLAVQQVLAGQQSAEQTWGDTPPHDRPRGLDQQATRRSPQPATQAPW